MSFKVKVCLLYWNNMTKTYTLTFRCLTLRFCCLQQNVCLVVVKNSMSKITHEIFRVITLKESICFNK